MAKPSARSGSIAERMGERGADRSAMGDHHDVAPGFGRADRLDGAGDTLHHIGEAFAPRRPLAGRRMPEAMGDAVAQDREFVIGQALPFAEMLFEEAGFLALAGGLRRAGLPECRRRQLGTLAAAW